MRKETLIPIGPYHPLLEEPEFFKFYVEGEKVVDAEVRIGYNHRGIEKLAESKTYDQDAFLVERICGICSTSHPFAMVQAAEDVSGVEIPERAKYIRTHHRRAGADPQPPALGRAGRPFYRLQHRLHVGLEIPRAGAGHL